MKKVYKNDGSIPTKDILCTTYQMRNFYLQMRDGFFSDLDVMNYIQHLSAVRMFKEGDVVLDVCCGRGLLLPLMRYHSKTIKKYIGVDIEEKNISSMKKNICNGKDINPKEHYPFDTEWVISNVSSMADKIKDKADFIVYTSAIEHMHKDHGEASIKECAKIIVPGGRMFLSCPNTPEGQDGYSVRYKAHVYEWKISELLESLEASGFLVEQVVGLTGSKKDFKTLVLPNLSKDARDFFDLAFKFLPTEFLKPILFLDYPELSSEVLLICRKEEGRNSLLFVPPKKTKQKKGLLI